MNKIKFGTDGWRAIIAEEYTIENLRRIATGTALWMRSKNMQSAIIGHDCRFGGKMFLEETARIIAQYNIKVSIAHGFVSTPMVSFGVIDHKADLGIVITASHNPPLYNGFKLKSSYGGPTIPTDIAEVEKNIPDHVEKPKQSFQELLASNKIQIINLEDDYFTHVKNNFNLDQLRSGKKIVYDAMYGAGQKVMKRILPDLVPLHCEYNPGFDNTPPEPIAKNLTEISNYLATHSNDLIGIAHDGDADRIAMLDEKGRIIDSAHIILLLVHYLHAYKKMSGKIVVSFSVTNKVKKLADHYGLDTIITKIGFKYIAELMITEDVLVAGEESGGIAIKGHIPERDGVWIGLTILEFLSTTNKSITHLIDEVYDIVGKFTYDRLDLHLSEEQINMVKEKLLNQKFNSFKKYQVILHENIDGEKFYFENDCWIMFRFSGTEPVLRIYAQGENELMVNDLLNAAKSTLGL